MKPIWGGQSQWLLALGGLALVVATSGCSYAIATSGVSSVGELAIPQTRAEVRAAFGEADETGTCPDGRRVERRSIRQQVRWPCTDPNSRECGEYVVYELGTFGMIEVLAVLGTTIDSELSKLHYAFVYGADDRVLYRYDVKAAPSTRLGEAVSPLIDSLFLQLEAGRCPSWEACLSAFASEVRQRAACVDYPLTLQDEASLHLMQALAVDVDGGRLAPDDTLAELQRCLGSPTNRLSWSCLRP